MLCKLQFDLFSSTCLMNSIIHEHSCKNDIIAPPCTMNNFIRPNKKIPAVARPYLNLLVKPRIFFRFSGKNIILCILKGKMPIKMHKIIFFPEKKIKNKYVFLPYLKFSDPLPETHIFFIWPKSLLCWAQKWQKK